MDELFFISIILWVILVLTIGIAIGSHINQFSQETMDKICQDLTNNSVATGYAEEGKLICEIPSYDHTQNIIIKTNGEEK